MAKKSDEQKFTADDFAPSVEDAPLDTGTLTGDVRDMLLTHMRSMTTPWAMLAEDEQRDKVYAASSCAEDVVRRVVHLITKAGFPSVYATVGAIKIDKGLEIKLAAAGTVENITALAQHGKASVVLVLAEAADYFGERAPAKVDKDQPDLPIAGDDE